MSAKTLKESHRPFSKPMGCLGTDSRAPQQALAVADVATGAGSKHCERPWRHLLVTPADVSTG